MLTARPLSDLVLDQHLLPLPNGVPRQAFSKCRVINEAIGALIGQGYTPEQAERHLIAEGADASISRHAVGLRILAGLNAR